MAKDGVEFQIHLTGDVSGKCWDGAFRAKEVLSFADTIQIERGVRDLLGPGPYDGMDPEVYAKVVMIARLRVYLTDAPEWWSDLKMADTNLLNAVYKGARGVIDAHDKKIEEEGKAAKEALSKSEK
jgi:hypothetical protein